MIPVVLGVTILIFTIMYFIPGDPVKMMLGADATPDQIVAIRQKLRVSSYSDSRTRRHSDVGLGRSGDHPKKKSMKERTGELAGRFNPTRRRTSGFS